MRCLQNVLLKDLQVWVLLLLAPSLCIQTFLVLPAVDCLLISAPQLNQPWSVALNLRVQIFLVLPPVDFHHPVARSPLLVVARSPPLVVTRSPPLVVARSPLLVGSPYQRLHLAMLLGQIVRLPLQAVLDLVVLRPTRVTSPSAKWKGQTNKQTPRSLDFTRPVGSRFFRRQS